MSHSIKLGILGTGRISRIILPMLPKETITLAGLFDVNTESAEALSKDLDGIPIFESSEALIHSPNIEAIYIATPPDSHAPLMRQAATAGKHVICEKPWVLHGNEAKTTVSALKEFTDIKIGCCSARFRFNPAANLAADYIQNGKLGKLRYVRILSDTTPPLNLDKLPPWKRVSGSAGGGLAADWCVYELEWLRGTLGELFDPIEVTSVFDDWKREGTDLESSYQVSIRCGSGVKILLTRTAQVGPPEHIVQLRGEETGLDVPFAPDSSIETAIHYTLDSEGKIKGTTLKDTQPDWEQILMGPIVDLAQAVRSDHDPIAPAASQLLIHHVLDAIYASGKSRLPVTL